MKLIKFNEWMHDEINEIENIRKDIQDIKNFIIKCNDENYIYDNNEYQTIITKTNRIEQYFIDKNNN